MTIPKTYSQIKQKQRQAYERIKNTEAQIDKLEKINIIINDVAFTKQIFTLRILDNVLLSPIDDGGGPILGG